MKIEDWDCSGENKISENSEGDVNGEERDINEGCGQGRGQR